MAATRALVVAFLAATTGGVAAAGGLKGRSAGGGSAPWRAAGLAPAPYAPWAHAHFVWLDSSQSNQANVTAYLAGYAAHNITVGGLDIDSAWSTGFNNFIVNTALFPDMGGLVAGAHAAGVNVILWMTSMVDTDSSNFATAWNNSYFIRDGFNQSALLKWWHGTGGLLDYGNPAAKSWWEGQLNVTLALGIDGWKVDGTDPYIVELLTPISAAGYVTYRDYADWYYGHTFNYTRAVNGDHCLIWSRPVDSYPIGLNLSAFLTFSPPYVMASGWVGDQDPTFYGLQMALINILESAWQSYANFGSDTGGYRSGSRTAEVLIRWAQVNAFLPLFENGGGDEHRPWMYDAPGSTYYTDIYRSLVAAHYELGPYLLTTGTAALLGGTSSITPQSAPPADFPFAVQPNMLGVYDYGYTLGDDYFVSPIVVSNVSLWNVTLPGGANDTWFEYWNPSRLHPANASFWLPVPLNTSAAFGRTGALLPLHVSTPLGLVPSGDASFASALTFLLHAPRAGATVTRAVHDWHNDGVTASATCAGGSLILTATPYERDVIFIVRAAGADAPTAVTVQTARNTTPASLRRIPAAPAAAHPAAHTAVGWEAAGPAPKWPIAGLAASLEAAAAPLRATWSHAPAATAPAQLDELIIRAGAAATGLRIVVDGVSACATAA